LKIADLPFRHVIAVDFEFEFGGVAGNRPRPVCMVAKDLLTGQAWRIWRGEFSSMPPFPVGPETLFVAYFASAEIGCFRALGWPTPTRILDLFAEFRDHTNGTRPPLGNGLLGALGYFCLDTIDAHEKREMQDLVLSGGPWSDGEHTSILDYCESDVISLERLLTAMLPHFDLPRALLRGRYMAAVAAIEFNGTPIDVPMLEQLREHWENIKGELVASIDADYGVYENGSFKEAKFEAFLVGHNIPWPRLESGRPDLKADTFRQMAKAYPIVAPLHELRHTLSDMRLNDLAVGDDGRNRTLLSPFASKTGRNQPSNTKFIFGPSVWLRGLIKPPPGYAVAYIDWSNQERTQRSPSNCIIWNCLLMRKSSGSIEVVMPGSVRSAT
jgi:DNA polymerase I